MKPFSGSGYDKDKLIIIPPPGQHGVNMPIQVDSLRDRLNAGVNAGNKLLISSARGLF